MTFSTEVPKWGEFQLLEPPTESSKEIIGEFSPSLKNIEVGQEIAGIRVGM